MAACALTEDDIGHFEVAHETGSVSFRIALWGCFGGRNSNMASAQDVNIKLIESDIPGAELPRPAEHCTVAILKRWLACRGGKVSGRREDLIKRVNDYIDSGLSHNLVDPDGGLNIQKKRLRLGLEQEVSPLTDVLFPQDGFEVGISCVPKIGFSQIWKYLIEEVEFKKQLSVEKPIVKGYNFYKSGKVLGLYSKTENDLFYIKSQVLPSYSKTGPAYVVKIIICANSEIQKAFCQCPAGNDGHCNHLAATLFAMEDIFIKSTNNKQTENNPLPCTSKPCTWNVPSKRKQEPTAIQEVKFEKHVYGKKRKDCKASTNTASKELGAPHKQQHSADLELIFEKIKSTEEKTGKKIGLSYIIPHDLPENAMPLDEIERTSDSDIPSKWDIVSPTKFGPLSMTDIKQKALRSRERLYNSVQERNVIAEETKGQHETRTWFDVRKPRITASQCKRCLLKPTTSPTKAISEVLFYTKQVQTKAMRDGIESESNIIQTFENETGQKVHKSGFIISETHPFLGASPDGVINDSQIVEVKKIVLKEGESLDDGMCRLGIYKKNGSELIINKNHKYYYQMQQQLFCSNRNTCHFIVSSEKGSHRESVPFDTVFWENVLPKLNKFYFDNIFPELVHPRILHGETRWNKDLQFPRLT